MFDFFNRFFKPTPPSGATAKERLRLVLLSDHLALAPDVIDALKADLMVVISRYVEIDQAHADVTFERREGDIAMLASIPITGLRNRSNDQSSPPSAGAPVETAPETAPAVVANDAGPETLAGEEAPDAPAETPADSETAAAGGPLAKSGDGDAAPAPRRRRRRRKAATVTTIASAQA